MTLFKRAEEYITIKPEDTVEVKCTALFEADAGEVDTDALVKWLEAIPPIARKTAGIIHGKLCINAEWLEDR